MLMHRQPSCARNSAPPAIAALLGVCYGLLLPVLVQCRVTAEAAAAVTGGSGLGVSFSTRQQPGPHQPQRQLVPSSSSNNSSSSRVLSPTFRSKHLLSKDQSVPGQAFHDWRTKLLARNFTKGTISAAEATLAASDSSSRGSSSSSSSSPSKPQHKWINIVGFRDQLPDLPGPPAVNTTHRAALQRVKAAKAMLGEAAARQAVAAAAEAAAHAAAAAAASAAALLAGPSLQDAGQPPTPETPAPVTFANADTAAQANSRATPTVAGEAAGGSSSSGDQPQQQQQREPEHTSLQQVELAMMSFVRRSPGSGLRLQLNGQPWLLMGFDVPQALALAVHELKRHQLLHLMDQARALGFNTLRVWAFADGGMPGVGSAVQRTWQQEEQAEAEDPRQQQQQGDDGGWEDGLQRLVLQPAPGILNATVVSAGLDWMVHVAGLRGLKLLLVLTNGASSTWGGMKQYTDWVDPALTVTDFYTNDTVKSVFLDYVAGLLGHASSLTGVPLREDPVVVGWQLAEAPSHPGHRSSESLLGWLKQMGSFIRQKAPHQLVLSGLEGFFGESSPHHLQHNPYTQVFDSPSSTPHAYSALCHGADFWLHHQLPELDVATAAVLPDKWLACSTDCKLEWARSWVVSHLREVVRLQKPLLLSGVGALRPHPWRRQLLTMVQQEVARAVQAGHPIAGVLLSGLSHPDMLDYSGWAIYDDAAGVHRARPPLTDDTTQAVAHVTWRRFSNHAALLSCLAEEAQGGSNEQGEAGRPDAWVDGWQEVLKEVVRIGQLTGCSSAAGGSAFGGAPKAEKPAA